MFERSVARMEPHSATRPFQRYAKFLIIGGINALVDLVVFNFLVLVHPTHSASVLGFYNTLAVGMALVSSYLGNRFWTFADVARRSRRQVLLFWLQAMVNMALNNAIVVSGSFYLTDLRLPTVVSNNGAKGLAMLLSSSVSYWLMKILVFRSHRSARRMPS